jgi:hypothetical protein
MAAMYLRLAPLFCVLITAAVLVACSSGSGTTAPSASLAPSPATEGPTQATTPPGTTLEPILEPTAEPMPDTTAEPAPDSTDALPVGPTPAVTDEPAVDPTPSPPSVSFEQPWATASLTDVTSGEQFRLADLAASGKTVFVETMAIWCSNCLAQQRVAASAFEGLDPSKVVWVGLDVETTESADALARYRDSNGFPFTYAIAGADISRALTMEFGDVVLSPPSVNLILLRPDGTVNHYTGQHTAAEIAALAAQGNG